MNSEAAMKSDMLQKKKPKVCTILYFTIRTSLHPVQGTRSSTFNNRHRMTLSMHGAMVKHFPWSLSGYTLQMVNGHTLHLVKLWIWSHSEFGHILHVVLVGVSGQRYSEGSKIQRLRKLLNFALFLLFAGIFTTLFLLHLYTTTTYKRIKMSGQTLLSWDIQVYIGVVWL